MGTTVGTGVEVGVGTASVADPPPQATTRARAKRAANAKRVSLKAGLGEWWGFEMGKVIGSRLFLCRLPNKKGLHIC